MARRTTPLALAVAVLIALAAPSVASARIAVSSTDLGRGSGKQLLVSSDIEDDVVVLRQNNGSAPGMTITSSKSIDAGAGCAVVSTTATLSRAQCDTTGVLAISIRLSELGRGTATGPETNRADTTGVAQSGPDGAPLPVRIDGGPGPDMIDDGPGPATVTAAGGDDFIDAGPGNDDLDGGLGDDVVLAGEGDDRFGDFDTPNSDILSGGPGRDAAFSRGTVTLNDLLCNDGADADAHATFGVPRSIVAPEGRLECSGTGADRDLIAGIEAVSPRFDTAGVDFTGSAADEVLAGLEGSDRFEGGGGRDSLLGSAGNDLLLARDDGEDARLDCGEGGGDQDRAVVDAVDPVEPNCETIERGGADVPGPVGGGEPVPPIEGFPPDPPPSPPLGNQPANGDEGNGAGGGDNGRTPPELEIPTRVAFVKRGRIQIRVRCVYRARACRGTLTLRAAQSKRAGRRRVRRGARLARGRVNVPWGTSRATTMRAPRSLVRFMRALRGRRTLRVRALVVAKDSGAGRRARSARRSRTVVLGLQR